MSVIYELTLCVRMPREERRRYFFRRRFRIAEIAIIRLFVFKSRVHVCISEDIPEIAIVFGIRELAINLTR